MSASARLPAVFVGHGTPMNALYDNEYTQAWAALGQRLGKPKAVLSISAHWETKGTLITAAEEQRTIHDFYNFPRELYAIDYPAPGDPALAKVVEGLLAPHARTDLDGWGLDHGTWSVLKFIYPDADVPTIQLSMDLRRTAEGHYQIGRQLKALRDQGVLIFGSGNIVHNLGLYNRQETRALAWASEFNETVKAKAVAGDHAGLVNFHSLPNARLAAPEPEHFHPLLYVLGATDNDEPVEILTDKVESSISMTTLVIGAA